jgi:two-component system, cell cycle sensor histidine kinase and response regulator CckA
MDTIEQPLFKQAPLFCALLDNIPNPIYCQDLHGFYLGYNKAFQNLFGVWPHESYINETVFELPITLEEAVSWHKADLELFRSPGEQTHENTLTFPDGPTRYITIRKSTFYQADGTIGGIVGFVSDRTESKNAEDGLRESEARFKDLSEASLEAIMFTDNGIITDVNHKMYEMFGYSNDDEIIGRSVLDFIAPDARSLSKERIDSGNEEKYETMGLKKDGVVFPVQVYPRELHLKGKSVRISVIRDLTEQKNMEEEVMKSKNLQSVGTLAGGVAHDFNNLLMAIIGNIALAKIHAPKGGKTVDYLTEAERMVFMGKNLTHQLLTFSHSIDTVKKITDIGPLIKETTEKTLRGSSIKLSYLIPADLSLVEVDEDQIRQVIQNIIVNAKEAMPAEGALHVSCENVNITPQHKLPPTLEEYIRIVIQDEGVGISEENLSKIFDPYFTTKDMGSQKGVGLGLAICYSIIKKHNGYILVDSVPGKGTTFQIYLPVYKQQVLSISVERKISSRGRGRILVVYDEEMVLKIAEKLLLHMGYEVITTQTGEEALWLYRQAMESGKPFDVVILDLSMDSGLGGPEVMVELLVIDPNVKAIISSGYLHDPVIINFENYGFVGILTKPYDPNELDEKLQNIIHPEEKS